MNTCRLAVVGLLRCFAVSAFLASMLVGSVDGARPKMTELLPENTLGVISIPDTQELATRFMNTSTGRMSQDPEMKPIFDQLYGSMSELVGTVQDKIGLSLPEIVAIPQGEVTFAVVAVKDAPPSMVLLLDAGDHIANARKLFDRWMAMISGDENSAAKREVTIKDVKITVFDNVGNGRTIAVFEKDSTLVVGNNVDVVKGILATWNGEKGRVLSDNSNFGTIMNRCQGTQENPPQIIWFVDPINIMRSIAEQNMSLRLGVAMLPVLGLDGLSAIGGSLTYDAGQYDAVSHIHILLENPRSGIIKMIALEPGVSKPESWAPSDVASYMTVHVKVETAIKTLAPMYDSLAGEGGFSKFIEQRFSTPTGIDLEKQVIPALEGRITYITWFEKPATMVSGVTLVALKLKDTEAISKALESLTTRFEGRITRETSAGKNYFRFNIPLPPAPQPPANGPDPAQVPIPCFGIVDDYFVFTNRPSLYEKVLSTAAEGTKSLADELEFKLIENKIKRQSGGAKPVMLGFNRPVEGFRYWYDLINTDRTREALKRQGERNGFFKALDTTLQKNPLPPFEVIQRYFAPGGSMAVDDSDGLHLMGFSLRRKGD
jgi:hypothetical protein